MRCKPFAPLLLADLHPVLCSCSRTLQPHLFHFTACNVKAGQEALLDYGQVGSYFRRSLAFCKQWQLALGHEYLTG